MDYNQSRKENKSFYAISLSKFEFICQGDSIDTVLDTIDKAQESYPKSAEKYLSNGFGIVQAHNIKDAKTIAKSKNYLAIF